MFIRDTYTEALRVSSGSSTNKIETVDASGSGYDGLIVTSTLTGVVTAYMITKDEISETAAPPYTTGVVLPALTAGVYKLHIGAVKCATGADAAKLVAFR